MRPWRYLLATMLVAVMRPVFGRLDVFLPEDVVTLGVGDGSGTEFPFDGVVGGHGRLGEVASEAEAREFLLFDLGGLGLTAESLFTGGVVFTSDIFWKSPSEGSKR